MFLKSLTLKGFKSFAEPTTLEFEPGVTVVVGPNGSGKSNVVDAVAWVLGAQGPSTVRSAKMEDVIFAGTAAAGRRWVGPRCRSRSTTAPASCPSTSPRSPSRRTLFRTGESEYAINRVPCRLLDIQELLSDTGRRSPAARDRVAGQPRRHPELPPRGAPPGHRGGGGRPQVPPPQGAGRAPPRVDRGQPGPAAGSLARSATSAAPPREAGRSGPAARRPGGRTGGGPPVPARARARLPSRPGSPRPAGDRTELGRAEERAAPGPGRPRRRPPRGRSRVRRADRRTGAAASTSPRRCREPRAARPGRRAWWPCSRNDTARWSGPSPPPWTRTSSPPSRRNPRPSHDRLTGADEEADLLLPLVDELTAAEQKPARQDADAFDEEWAHDPSAGRSIPPPRSAASWRPCERRIERSDGRGPPAGRPHDLDRATASPVSPPSGRASSGIVTETEAGGGALWPARSSAPATPTRSPTAALEAAADGPPAGRRRPSPVGVAGRDPRPGARPGPGPSRRRAAGGDGRLDRAPCSSWSRSTKASKRRSRRPPGPALAAVVVDGAEAARAGLDELQRAGVAGAVVALPELARAADRSTPAPPGRSRPRSHRRRRRLLVAGPGAVPASERRRPAGPAPGRHRRGRRRAGRQAVDLAISHPDLVVVTRAGRPLRRRALADSAPEARRRPAPPSRRPGERARPAAARCEAAEHAWHDARAAASSARARPRSARPGRWRPTPPASRAAADARQRVAAELAEADQRAGHGRVHQRARAGGRPAADRARIVRA